MILYCDNNRLDAKFLVPRYEKRALSRRSYCEVKKTSDQVSGQHMPNVCPSERRALDPLQQDYGEGPAIRVPVMILNKPALFVHEM